MAIGAITGAGAGAITGSLADYGIADDFVKKLSETIPNESSALFILFREVNEDKVLPEIQGYQPRVIRTAEEKLKVALKRAA
jgi:uncharacterized membrane protein